MHNNKTVFVVDDDREICLGLECLFQSVNLNVETYDSAITFLTHYNPSKLGCLILDLSMPGMSGIELLDKLNSQKSLLPVIIMTGNSDIQIAVKAIKAGAVEFIIKPIIVKDLLETIFHHLEKPINCDFNFHPKKNLLTKREQEIINLIMDGKFNKEIAYDLSISIATVEAHRSRIMRKFNAKNLAQLIRRYLNIPDHYIK